MSRGVLLTTMCLIGALLFPIDIYAQCGGKRPTWAVDGYHVELSNSYLEVIKIVGTDAEELSQQARQEGEENRRQAVGDKTAWVKSTRIGSPYYECTEKGMVGYFLYQTRKRPDLTPEPVLSTQKYPFSTRVFVPGMAQIHKGSLGKGIGFIAGEVVCIGGVVVAECLRQNYTAQIGMTHNARLKSQYAYNANVCNITRNVCIGGIAAVYVWNIIDGIVARGKPYVSFDGKMLSLAPFATYDGGGLAVNFTF